VKGKVWMEEAGDEHLVYAIYAQPSGETERGFRRVSDLRVFIYKPGFRHETVEVGSMWRLSWAVDEVLNVKLRVERNEIRGGRLTDEGFHGNVDEWGSVVTTMDAPEEPWFSALEPIEFSIQNYGVRGTVKEILSDVERELRRFLTPHTEY